MTRMPIAFCYFLTYRVLLFVKGLDDDGGFACWIQHGCVLGVSARVGKINPQNARDIFQPTGSNFGSVVLRLKLIIAGPYGIDSGVGFHPQEFHAVGLNRGPTRSKPRQRPY